MKILILTDRLDTGGAETHIESLAGWLVGIGEQVTVLSSGGDVADRLESIGIPQIRMDLNTRNPFRLLWIRRKLRKLIVTEHFDILHAHARLPALLIRGMRKKGCCEIVTVHAHFQSGFWIRHICNWGEYSIAVSEDLRTYLHQSYRVPTERISVIQNGIDTAIFYPPNNAYSGAKHRILFASRLDEDCALGAELLCRIAPSLFAEYPDLQITIAGGGNAFKRLSELAAQSNSVIGFDCITLCGKCDAMADLMRAHDIFVGVSRAALEATACGCAVVLCGNEGYLGILNGDRCAHAVLSNLCGRNEKRANAALLRRDLCALLSSASFCKACADSCRSALFPTHDVQKTCAETLALYRRARHVSHTKIVTIGGYFGCGNLGDDAILQAFLTQMSTLAPTVRVQVLTGTPHQTHARFNAPCFHRKNPFSVLYASLCSSACLCGGGSLLQNGTGKLSLCYYNTLLHVFARLGGGAILYSAGIGPLYGNHAAQHTRAALGRCRYISLRDPDSMKLLTELGIDRARLHLGADPALLLPPPPPSRDDAILSALGIAHDQKYICTVLRAGKQSEEICRIAVAATRMLCNRYGWHPLFVCLSPEDGWIHAAAASRLGASLFFPTEAGDVSAILRRAELTISMRLHAMILGATVACPFVGLSAQDDPKITSFAKLCAQEALTPDELSVGALVDACERTHRSRDAMHPIFCDAVREMQKNAQKDLANIVSMVYNINRYDKKSEDLT